MNGKQAEFFSPPKDVLALVESRERALDVARQELRRHLALADGDETETGRLFLAYRRAESELAKSEAALAAWRRG